MIDKQIIATLIFQFALIITFITIFFFTFVKKVERDIIEDQIDRVMIELSEELELLNDSAITMNLKKLNLEKPNLSQEDKNADDNNKKIQKKALIILLIIVPICLIVAFLMIKIFKLSAKETIILGFAGLLIVIIIEITFLLVFARNYRTLDSNVVKKGIVDSLITYRDS